MCKKILKCPPLTQIELPNFQIAALKSKSFLPHKSEISSVESIYLLPHNPDFQ